MAFFRLSPSLCCRYSGVVQPILNVNSCCVPLFDRKVIVFSLVVKNAALIVYSGYNSNVSTKVILLLHAEEAFSPRAFYYDEV